MGLRDKIVGVTSSLKAKFSLLAVALIVLTMIFVSLPLALLLRESLEDLLKEHAIANARVVAGVAAEPLLAVISVGKELDKDHLYVVVAKAVQQQPISEAVIVDKDRTILAHNDLIFVGERYEPPPGVRPLGAADSAFQPFELTGVLYYDVAVPVVYNHKGEKTRIGEVHLRYSGERISQAVSETERRIILVTAVAIVLASIIASLLVSMMIRPLHTLVDKVEQLGGGDLDIALDVNRRDEIGQLAESFNRMTARLRSFRQGLLEQGKLNHELSLAQQIQASLLPAECPAVPGFEFGGFYDPAEGVGGDYYDFIRVDPEHIGIVVADVSGKGVPAGLLMATFRTLMRAAAPGNTDAADVLRRVHAQLQGDLLRGMFITAFYGVLNTIQRTLTCANAGHIDPLIYRADSRKIKALRKCGIALGVDTVEEFNSNLQNATIVLHAGDLVIEYTDGINEAQNARGELFGNQRLYRMIEDYYDVELPIFMKMLDEKIARFRGSGGLKDDITVIAVKVT